MERIAEFSKVSYKQFLDDYIKTFKKTDKKKIKEIYDSLIIPKRATSGSAGYDFFAPEKFVLEAGESIKIPTGIRAKINDGWMLQVYPRSGLGFKYRLQLDNTVGIIDSDYFYSENEGHIFIKITNDSRKEKSVSVEAGGGFAQGIFVGYGITFDDNATSVRNGGFGSTDKKEQK